MMNKFFWSFITISTILTIYNIFGKSINDGVTYFVEIVRNLGQFIPIEIIGLIIYIVILLLIKYVQEWK